jgi:hypothetical protein
VLGVKRVFLALGLMSSSSTRPCGLTDPQACLVFLFVVLKGRANSHPSEEWVPDSETNVAFELGGRNSDAQMHRQSAEVSSPRIKPAAGRGCRYRRSIIMASGRLAASSEVSEASGMVRQRRRRVGCALLCQKTCGKHAPAVQPRPD